MSFISFQHSSIPNKSNSCDPKIFAKNSTSNGLKHGRLLQGAKCPRNRWVWSQTSAPANRSPCKIVSYDLAIFSPPLQSNVDENDVLASNLSTEILAKTIMRYISTMNLWKDFLALTGCCCFCCCCWHGGPSKKLFQRQSVVSCLALRKGVHDISWTFFVIPEFNGFTVHGFTGLLVYSRSGAATFSTLKSQFAPHFLERTQPERWDSEFHRSYSTPPTSQGHWNDHLAHGGWNSSYMEFNS